MPVSETVGERPDAAVGAGLPPMAVLIVCFNRREKTLNALRKLNASRYADRLQAVVFDDGSTDGTREAIATEFPDAIVVTGDGSAYWNRGLYEAWTRAMALDVGAYCWLNDDVDLDGDAFDSVAAAWNELVARGHSQFILVGAMRGADGNLSYSGFDRMPAAAAFRLQQVAPNGHLRPVDTFNGNFVVVAKAAFDRLGRNDPAFFHNFGDIDYGLRARKGGVDVLLLPRAVGVCPANTTKDERSFGGTKVTLFQNWRIVNTYQGLPPRSWYRLTRRHSGAWWPLHFLLPYRHLIIPSWVERLVKRSKPD